MAEKMLKQNGYQTPEMIADSIHKYGHFVGCTMMDQFLNKYYIYDGGSGCKVGVEVTFLNGKAVATRKVPVESLRSLSVPEVQFGDF